MTRARSLYVAASEGDTGKSTIALGVLQLLIRFLPRVAVFRPVARSVDEPDYVLDLLLHQPGVIPLTYDECVGSTYHEVLGDPDAALGQIIGRYHEVEKRADAVLIVGSDYSDVASPVELAFNGRVAVNLGAPVLLVVSGLGRTPEVIRQIADVARTALEAAHAHLLGLAVNRCDGDLDAVRSALADGYRVWALPEEPLLSAPTMGALLQAVQGQLAVGDEQLLAREVRDVTVGAMTIEHLLDRLVDGQVVITPGDRTDVVLGLLAAHAARDFPSLAGIILNGGYRLTPTVGRLVQALDPALPIITTELRTVEAASAVNSVRGRLTRSSQRKIDTALALFDAHVDPSELTGILDVERSDVVTPLMFEYDLFDRARVERKHVVLPEGDDDRVLRAAGTLLQRQVVDLTILGDETGVRARAAELGLDLSAATVVDPHTSPLRERFAQAYAALREHKGMTLELARDVVTSVSYFGTLMVEQGLADGMVSGARHTTADTIRPAFEIIRVQPDTSIVSSVFLMCLEDKVLVYGDCAVNPDPTAEQLADIAISSAATAAQFGIEPRIAMLSYSTGSSGHGADVDKVRTATDLVRQRRPDLSVEGPIQYDAAVDASVARTKLPESAVAGRASVFIFPDLNTGNNTYKAVQRSAGAVAIGPVLQGLRRPVNDLSRGATVEDIINTVVITALQAQAVTA
ncbi:MAG: phosphate acetyltransferase [Jatrophihabitans sp.]|uniref:phosphate acetyltransferase n=1 Tax=Jatrophihabitans sp. TaxID=1932789 RepID=UPI003F7E3C4C